MSACSFFHPEPLGAQPRIYPVFLTFQGCPTRCVFCAQNLQTGLAPRPLRQILEELDAALGACSFSGELAFYGGTFTAMPLQDQLACLELAARHKADGRISRVRCSTRPDCLDAPLLDRLKSAGLDMVELGIQSFSPQVLSASTRGYSPESALAACRLVRDSGLALGIQLMPGLPSGPGTMTREEFLADMRLTVAQAPEVLRLYPCLVMRGTELAALWQQGRYQPWSLEETIPALAQALLLAWGAGIRVIRLGVAPEKNLESAILAGPEHPALGAQARARALYLFIRARIDPAAPPRRLLVPRSYQGEFWGHKRSLAAEYAALGVTKEVVHWHDEPFFSVE